MEGLDLRKNDSCTYTKRLHSLLQYSNINPLPTFNNGNNGHRLTTIDCNITALL